MGILGGSSYTYYDKLLESATSQVNLEPNWAAILEICDTIRQKDVPAKYALAAMKKKMMDRNPHVCQFALSVLEACMKNCGTIFHDETASKDFMGELRDLIKNGNDQIKNQVLSMIQTWNFAFRNKPAYKIFQDTYNLLKIEGHTFPESKEADAMFSADSAPEWAEGDVCHVCRVKFSTFTRQHHCRCCGQVFCARCSSKSSIIPKFGIEREVRVCDPCYDQINPASSDSSSPKGAKKADDSDLPSEYLNSPLSKEEQVKPKVTDVDEAKAQEEEELQLAMALSLSAAEVEKKGSQSSRSLSPGSANQGASSAPPMESVSSSLYANTATTPAASENADPEMSRYLNRQYWEEKSQGQSLYPTAPVSLSNEPPVYAEPTEEQDEDSSETAADSSAFISTIQNSLDVFVDRMQLVTSKGRHIAMDQTVQTLFQSLTAMHPQLVRLVEEEEEQKAKYEAMLEKVALIREARESLNDMRKQHSEKLRQQELEQEMLRRMQMEQKLELMRQQKQEYLEYQHQLQIQRQQELDVQQQYKLQQKQMAPQGYYPQAQYPGPQYDGMVNPNQVPQYATGAPQVNGNAGQYGQQQLPQQQPDMGYQNPPAMTTGYEPQSQIKQEPTPPQYQQYQPQVTSLQNDPSVISGRPLDKPMEQSVPPQYPNYPNQQLNHQAPQSMDMRQVMNAVPNDLNRPQYQGNQPNQYQATGASANQPQQYPAGSNQQPFSQNSNVPHTATPPQQQQGGSYPVQGNAQPASQLTSSQQAQPQQQQPGLPLQQQFPPSGAQQQQQQQQQQIQPQHHQIPPQQHQMQAAPQQVLQQQQQIQPQQHQIQPQQHQMQQAQQQPQQPVQPQQHQMQPPQQHVQPQQQMNQQGYPLQAVQPQMPLQQTSPQQTQQGYPQHQQQMQPQSQNQNQFPEPQQDIPASSHLHDMQLISFE